MDLCVLQSIPHTKDASSRMTQVLRPPSREQDGRSADMHHQALARSRERAKQSRLSVGECSVKPHELRVLGPAAWTLGQPCVGAWSCSFGPRYTLDQNIVAIQAL